MARLVPQTPPLNGGQRADNPMTRELMMKNREIRQSHVAVGALWIAASMTLVACSKGDTVNSGNTQSTPVTSCGTLSAVDAAQFFSTRLEHFGSVGLAALAGLENSRAAARVLSFGYGHIIDPFVADDQANLHDSLGDFRDDYLITANVESATDSSVTFLLNPQTQCEDTAIVVTGISVSSTGGALGAGGAIGTGGAFATGGTSASNVDPSCVAEKKAHPTRIRISRIDCSNGDNVAIEVLYGPQSTRVALAELYAERAELEVDLGAFLTNSYSVTITGPNGPSTQTRTEKPIVSSAVGVLHGSMTLTSSNQGTGRISVTNAIDFTTAEEAPTRFQFPAGTDIGIINADGAAKTIQVDVKSGAFDSNVTFKNFIGSFFNLSTTNDASTQSAVALHVPAASGSIKLDGAADQVTLNGIDFAGAAATATQAGRTLLTVTAAAANQSAVSAVFTGNSDDSLGVACADGLAIDIHYGLEPVMSVIQAPANYIASDTLRVLAPAASNLTLWKELASDDLAVSSSGTGELLRVNAGSLSLQSATWPNDSVTTTSNQCLTCNVVTQSGHNDLLDDYTVGACTQ